MPWPTSAEFYNFNEFSILLNALPQYGVYGIFDKERNPLLVGAGEVRIDLLRVIECEDSQLLGLRPTLFSYVPANAADAEELKRKLIAELAPPCNHESDGMAQASGM
jgi:hypothetical protein